MCRSLTTDDINIFYKDEYVDIEEADGSKGFINMEGNLNLDVILKGIIKSRLYSNSFFYWAAIFFSLVAPRSLCGNYPRSSMGHDLAKSLLQSMIEAKIFKKF
jgi:hypothetical protein